MRRNPRARYPLPNPIEPDLTACLKMTVPDSREYRVAIRGQLYALSRAYVWADDPDHFALDAAARMRDAYETLTFAPSCGECPCAYAVPDDVYCPQDSGLRAVRMMSTGDGCDSHERVYFSRSIIDVGSGVARIGYSFFDFSDDTDCATAIVEIRAFQTGVGSPSWSLQWRDSSFDDHEETSFDDEFFFGAIPDAQKICLSLNSNFCAVMTINGPCIPLEA